MRLSAVSVARKLHAALTMPVRLPFVTNSRGVLRREVCPSPIQALATALAARKPFRCSVAPAAATRHRPSETYSMIGYEIYYAPDLGDLRGTGAGTRPKGTVRLVHVRLSTRADIARQRHRWFGRAAASRRRADQRRFLRRRRRPDQSRLRLHDQTYAVLARLMNVTRTDMPGATGNRSDRRRR